jgi:hypothetical protein
MHAPPASVASRKQSVHRSQCQLDIDGPGISQEQPTDKGVTVTAIEPQNPLNWQEEALSGTASKPKVAQGYRP